jgi:general secretion pathway protein D
MKLFSRLALFLSLIASPALAQSSQGLNYNNADLRVFLQDIAMETGLTLVIDPKVRGQVTILSEALVDRDTLIELMKTAVRVNGFSSVPMAGGGFKIIDTVKAVRDAKSTNRETGDALVTRIFNVKFTDPELVFDSLRGLIDKQGIISWKKGQSQIVVTDFAGNVLRMEAIIDTLDIDNSVTQSMALQNTSATEMREVLAQLILAEAQSNNKNRGIRAIPMKGSNTLILRGHPDAVGYYRPLLENIDRDNVSSSDIRVYKLKYASAEVLLPMLQTLAFGGMEAKQGSDAVTLALYDDKNAIIVNGDANTQKWIADVIGALDFAQPQVLVEAIIVEVSDNASRQLGINYLIAGGEDSTIPFTVTNLGGSTPKILATAGAIIAEGDDADGDSSISSVLRARALDSFLGTSGLLIGGGGTRSDGSVFGAVLNALRRDVSSNILSTPSIMTLDNEKASFIVGQEIPITTGEALGSANANPFRTIDRKNVGVQLEVEPQINQGDEIKLRIRQEVSAIAGPLAVGSTELITTKREMETSVRVGDGDVIVLGGLVRQNERITVDRVPILGSIPLLGRLFRSSGKVREKTNLMTFLRTTIIRTADEAEKFTARQYGALKGLDGNGIPEIELRDVLKLQTPIGQ